MDIEEIDETDEVEREIDIVYSGKYSDESKIFQFPLIPKSSMNIENINSLSKDENMKSLKMDLNIDQKYLDKNNYNAVPIKTLKGEKIENNSNICLGMLKNNKLYLIPVSQMFQFRQDFSSINKEKTITIKKDRKELKNLSFKKDENNEANYIPLTVHQPDSIDSKIMIERLTQPLSELKNADFMKKEEYFNFLLKYVIAPESGGDSNDDNLSFYKNNFSKEFLDNVPEEKNEEDNNMIIEKEKEKENGNEKDIKKSNSKSKGFNSGIDAIRNSNNEKNSKKIENGNGFVSSIINGIYEDVECLYYDKLLEKICQNMNISKDDEENVEKIKKEIEENCIIVKENICFLKYKGDNDVLDVRNLLIREIGNMDNRLKKQQIKKIIEQNGLSISDNKLKKLLPKICTQQGNLWAIKTPDEI